MPKLADIPLKSASKAVGCRLTAEEWVPLLALLPNGYDSSRGVDPEVLYFDADCANRAVAFVESLTHTSGPLANTPFKLERWQRAIVGCLFGWRRRRDKSMRYTEGLFGIPRKSGKTPLASAIALYYLFHVGDHGAEIYAAAADSEQASILYRYAKGMIENSPELAGQCRIYLGENSRRIAHEERNAVLRVLSSDAKRQHGLTPSLVIVDELHAQDDRELVDTLTSAMAALNRTNPLVLYVTTSDYDRPSICNEKWGYAEKVASGAIEDTAFLPVLYQAGADDDWTLEATWEKANPNLGVSVSLDFLRRECQKARSNPALENTFRRLHLNQKTATSVVWMPLPVWDASSGLSGPGESPEVWRARMLEEKAGEPCVLGLDLSQRVDVTALSLVFPADKESGTWVVVPFFWVPADNVRKREKKDHVEYAAWARRGFVEMTPGDWIDQDAIRRKIEECCERFDVREVAYDPWNADALGQALTNAGIPAVRVRQGMQSLSEPMKTFFGITLGGRMHHGGNPVLRWMIGNTAAKTDVNGNIQPDKARSTERIDGVTATLTAMAAALKMDFSGGTWDYATQGLPGI